eukprot:5110424-Amphidinium_carterae.1
MVTISSPTMHYNHPEETATPFTPIGSEPVVEIAGIVSVKQSSNGDVHFQTEALDSKTPDHIKSLRPP